MYDSDFVEQCYNKFIPNLDSILHESIYHVDLDFLQRLDLLHFMPGNPAPSSSLHPRFYALESPDKITLISERFIVWIVLQTQGETPSTLLLIAVNRGNIQPDLEAAILASGVYNQSKLVLKILEKFLEEIDENEAALLRIWNLS